MLGPFRLVQRKKLLDLNYIYPGGMREGMPLIFGWKVDFAKHPNVEALENSAVSLNGRHHCYVGFGIKVEAFRDKIQKIKLKVGYFFALSLFDAWYKINLSIGFIQRVFENTFLLYVDPLRSNFRCIVTPDGSRLFITTSRIFFWAAWKT